MNNTTKSAQFTPGPWHLEHDVDGIPLTIIGSDGSAISTVETWNDCTEGNRLVLTAAPAMYEALVETMRVLRSLRDSKEEWYTLVTPELLNVWDRNKQAISQAEGRHHE